MNGNENQFNIFDLFLKEVEPIFKNWMREVLAESKLVSVSKTPSNNIYSRLYLTVREVAEVSNKKPDTIRKKSRINGEMPPRLPGKNIKFKSSEIKEWIELAGCGNWDQYLIDKKAKKYTNSKRRIR